jgi:hypothetical protein
VQRQQRLPAIPPALLTEQQKELAADMKEGIARSFQGFVNVRDDGALLGPWNPWLHHPRFGEPIWDLTKVIALNQSVPAASHEIAILATGTRFKAPYELYAHEIVAKRKGLSNEKIAAILAGRRPVDLTKERLSRTTSQWRWYPAACCLSRPTELPWSNSAHKGRQNCPI